MSITALSHSEIIERVQDVVLSSDRTFFEQHRKRSFRLRPAFDVEIEDFVRCKALRRPLPEGLCWWIAVKQLRPGFRRRIPFAAPHDLPTEVPEKIARRMWRRVYDPPSRKRDADFELQIITIAKGWAAKEWVP